MKTSFNLLLSIVFLSSFQIANASLYLSDAQVQEAVDFLPAPPVAGSPEYIEDFKKLHALQESRTETQCAMAALEAPLKMPMPFLEPMGPLVQSELPAWNNFASILYTEVKPILKATKTKWGRARPYLTDPSLTPCVEKEDSFAYPSGHATLGELYGKVFAFAYPAQSEVFLWRAKTYGQDRVLGGVHHPSDVKAGQAFADHLFDLLIQNENFKAELQKLKK